MLSSTVSIQGVSANDTLDSSPGRTGPKPESGGDRSPTAISVPGLKRCERGIKELGVLSRDRNRACPLSE